MSDKPTENTKFPDPATYAKLMNNLAEKNQKIVTTPLKRQTAIDSGPIAPINGSDAFITLTQKILNDPNKLAEAKISLRQGYMSLRQTAARLATGEDAKPMAHPERVTTAFVKARKTTTDCSTL